MRRERDRIPLLTWPAILVLATNPLVLLGCNSAVRSITREAKPLTYVGQIQFGEPTNEAGQVVIPLNYEGG
ncbi:MAG: hypothetical protein P8L85_20365 [Rubripirellula sp.]|nr:hypothetical protein [Rubripirellula sp.]